MPEVVTDVRVARGPDRIPAGAAPLVRPSWSDRIEAHVSLVEDTLARRISDVQAVWDANTVDGRGADESDLPCQLRELLERGGKRTRPVMVFLGWVAAGARGHQHGHHDMVIAAAAVEMLHCFALVHDDLMDESPIRRGHPTVHERAAQRHLRRRGIGASARYGDNIAVLVGDLAHSEADRLAASLPAEMREVWQQLVLELLAGQVADVVGSTTGDRRLEFARLVARQKTGYYTVARPLQLGAVAAGAGTDALTALADYGRHAGEAFALRDDVLGVYGDPRTTGKPAGDDIRSGKPTVLLALAAQSLDGAAAAALRLAGTSKMTDADVCAVQQAMVEKGILASVEAMIDDRVGDAVAALDPSALSVTGITQLTLAVDDLARRGR
jgi:geranylgeranyl diphosphate synthase type I